ncbi:hypothetical protein J4558_25615 [Leptolyngbya sp. 15MV]|nr:hypothetical protein J4558_25615 [Leptolyngbya sp. 15MV]
MQNTSYLRAVGIEFDNRPLVAINETGATPFALDTTFVLYFLALDFGQAWIGLGYEGLLSTITLLAFIILPYFLLFSEERPLFQGWVAGRFILAAFGIVMGLLMRQAIGILLPEWFAYMPMTLLIASAFFSLYFQLYGILRFRLSA